MVQHKHVHIPSDPEAAYNLILGAGTNMTASPDHYTTFDIECWDWYEQVMTKEEFCGHMKGNICKYLYRVGYKWDDIEDLEKIVVYANRWIKKLKPE